MDEIFSTGPDFLSREIGGEAVGTWLALLLLWALLSALFIITNRILRGRLRRYADRTKNRYDDVIATLVRQTRVFFLIALALFVGVAVITLSPFAVRGVGRVVFVLFMLQMVFWGNSIISLYVQRYKEEKLEADAAAVTTMQAMGFLGRLLLFTTVALLVLANFGVEIAPLLAGLGVGGIAVALAVQSVLSDLFASLSIVLDKPFVVGDFLVVNEYMGTVEHVGLKTTRLRSLSGEQIILSNSDLLKARIRNYKRMFERRVVFSLGVTYQTPYDKLEAIPLMLRGIVEAQDMVRFDRAHFMAYGGSALNFEVVYFVLSPDYNLYMDIHQAINLEIYKQFDQAEIEFAYPTQTLFVEKLPEASTSALNGGDHR